MSDSEDELFARGNPRRNRPVPDGKPLQRPKGSGRTDWPEVSRSAQNQIGTGLRSLYDELLKEPVPEHLTDLIHRLK